MADTINNAEVVGTFFSCNSETKYTHVNNNYFSGSNGNITLQPGTYMLILSMHQTDLNSTRSCSFAGLSVAAAGIRDNYMDWKVVTIDTATTYSHDTANGSHYAPWSGTVIRLN